MYVPVSQLSIKYDAVHRIFNPQNMFFVSVQCARLSWPSRQLLSVR